MLSAPPERKRTVIDLVRRTNLLVSLKSVEGVDRVWRRGADAVTLDLRDVTTAALDQRARKWIRISIGFAAYGGAEVFIALGKDDVERHMEAAVWPGISGIVLYDVDSAEDVVRSLPLLESMEGNRGDEQRLAGDWFRCWKQRPGSGTWAR